MRSLQPASRPLLRHALASTLVGVAASAGLFTTVARAGGPPLPPGQELGTQPGDVDGDGFQDSEVCRNCHYTGTAIDPHMAGDTFAGTMMANAMRDPAFHAALAVANQDDPGIGTFCIRCHSPLAWVRGNATADPTGATSLVDEVDSDGVSCEACHRTNPAPDDLQEGAPYLLGDGRLFFDDVATKRGPYVSCDDEPDDPACSLSPGHLTVREPALGDAAFCGQCHQVSIPGRKLRDDEGAITTHDFPLDTTYPEWAASDFRAGGPDERTCQSCHMATTQDGPACNVGGPEREAIPQHGFVGGNHWGIRAVMETNPDRVTEYAAAFETALARTLELLQTAASVTLLEVPADAAPGDTIDIRVRVENLSGHKFPTGYAESRRAWLQVAVDRDFPEVDSVVLGAYDEALGEIVDPASTRVYHAQHGTWNGSEAAPDGHLVLHDAIVVDTRIPPRGFVPDATTMPKGPIDYANDEGGFDHFDEVTLTVTLPDDIEDPVATLRVDLVYQSMTRQHVLFLESENDTNVAGERLREAFEATDEAPPLLVASAAREIAFPGNEGAGGGGGAGGGEPGTGGAGTTTTSAATTGATTSVGSAASGGDGSGGGDDLVRGNASPSDGCGCRVVGRSVSPEAGHGWVAALGLVAVGSAIARRARRRPGVAS